MSPHANHFNTLFVWGCTPTEETSSCQVVSELDTFQPICSQATLSLYDDQTIVELSGGSDAMLSAYLEPSPSIQAYGGETGNTLSTVLEVDTESWTAVGRKTTLTFASFDSDSAEIRIDAHFPDGLNVDGFGVQGPFEARLIDHRLEDSGD